MDKHPHSAVPLWQRLALAALAAVLAVLLALNFFVQYRDRSVTKTTFLLDTVVTVTLYGTRDESAIDGCFDLCSRYEQIFSRTLESSELARLNRREISEVSDDLAQVIALGLYYGKLSDGGFTVTIGGVSSLWDFKAEVPALPNEQALAAALQTVGDEFVSLSGNTVTFSNPDTMLDLGAVAKGYIADRLGEYLTENGITSAVISLGGNVLCVGAKPDGSDFSVGIQYPFDQAGRLIDTVYVSNRSVVTSGVYQRCFTLQGKLYHHILNPATGYPYENDLYSVTILSDRSVDGDALSTVCFALGAQKTETLLDTLPGISGIFVTAEDEVIRTQP